MGAFIMLMHTFYEHAAPNVQVVFIKLKRANYNVCVVQFRSLEQYEQTQEKKEKFRMKTVFC